MTLAINVGDDAPEWVSGWVARSGIPLSLQGTPLIFEVDPQLPHRRGPYLPAARAEDFRVSVEGDSGSPSRITVFGRTPRAPRRAVARRWRHAWSGLLRAGFARGLLRTAVAA